MKRKVVMVVLALIPSAIACAAFLFYYSVTHRVEGQYFDSAGVRLHYTVEGEGDPVILIHGFAANADLNWRAPGVTAALAKHYKVISLDNRGHGLSEKPEGVDAYGTSFCEDIVRLMDHLQIEKARIVGYSMGAFITLKFVTMHPDRVVCAVAGGAGWEDPEKGLPERERIVEALKLSGDYSPLFEAISPPGEAPKGWVLKQINFTMSLTNNASVLADVMQSLDQLSVTEDQLRSNTVPVLSIVGTEDPLRRGIDRMDGIMGNLEVVLVEGTNHITTIASPDFLQAVEDFLAAHGEEAALPEAA